MHLHKTDYLLKPPNKCRILSNRSPSTREANEYIAYILVEFNLPLFQPPIDSEEGLWQKNIFCNDHAPHELKPVPEPEP